MGSSEISKGQDLQKRLRSSRYPKLLDTLDSLIHTVLVDHITS